jgi:ceramide glucosyltransferase
LSLLIKGTYLACRYLTKPTYRSSVTIKPEPISILKPLKGNEPLLEQNLRSFFQINYFKFEILFSIADANDPSRAVVENLIAQYPLVAASLVIGEERIGPNPKVNNLVRSYRDARFDWILISDSNVEAPSNYLHEKIRNFTPDVGVVTAVVHGTRPSSLGGYLEAAFLNTFYARWMFLSAYFGQECVVGKSMLFRKSTATRFGGFQQLGRFLAEDYMTGRAMRMLGLKVIMMNASISQPLGNYGFIAFWRRHIRWGRIRKSQAPLPVFFEPWTTLLPSGIAGAYALHSLFAVSPIHAFLSHALIWFLADMAVSTCVGEKPTIRYCLAWILRELLALPMWLQMVSGSTVDWRGTKLRLKSGGLLEAK